MSNILRKNIIALILVILLNLILGAGVFMVFHLMKIRTNNIYEIKEKLASYQKNKKSFEDEVKSIKSLENRTKALEEYRVSTETIPSLLSILENIAAKNSILFEITSVQTPIENEKTKLYIEFNSKGSFSEIQNFFEELQHQTFQVQFKKMFLFSEKGVPIVTESSGTLSTKTTKSAAVPKEIKWQGVATIEIQSF